MHRSQLDIQAESKYDDFLVNTASRRSRWVAFCFLLIALGGFPQSGSCQGTYFGDVPAWSSGLASGTSSVALGDVDGDGDLDLICGNQMFYSEATTLYLNQNGVFEAMPSWSSGLASCTHGVALGDIDKDGDLDLVCGNSNGPTTLYLSQGTVLDTMPSWSSGLADPTWSVALGDIDGDGDLDLICGNRGEFYGPLTTLYLNQGGAFETMPSWYAQVPGTSTVSVALGDVNGDGALDLVCGNYGESTILYLNQQGVLGDVVAWSSGLASQTSSVALGDIDGDGDLDLVCGNTGECTTLYLNQGDVFEAMPSWYSGLASQTSSVMLGDVDGDGDLDLVCGNDGQGTTLYLNQGGVLATAPAWSSELISNTQSVALGDVDADGDLDLICGNTQTSTTLYLNQGDVLEPMPSWSSGLASNTRSVALGDIDGDGDPDLACGNYEESTALYLNQGGVLEMMPAWSSGLANSTRSVALGDVDDDGGLDLICGNEGQSTTLYMNRESMLERLPSWSSGLANTNSVTLGDTDDDGDLDLVCGNDRQNTVLYLNQSGMFETTPAWSSGLPDPTRSVALMDIDADGDLDLVCGNWGNSTSLYLNQSGVFEAMPSWSSGLPSWTQSAVLGDVDGDGDVDLVCGGWGMLIESTTLYLNQGGVLEAMPSWSSGLASKTTSVALGDIDGDGDLDLICGNEGESTTLYMNRESTLERVPSWYSGLASQTRSAALGDIDGDGDLDLVCGNAGESATVYLNEENPAYKGNPLAPTNQLPNNGAHLRWVSTRQSDSNTYRVYFKAVDVESDSLWLVLDYQRKGAPQWQPAVVGGRSAKTRAFATSPAGRIDSLEWDTHLLPFDRRDVVLRLRAIENPQHVSLIQHVAPYRLDVGLVEPHRPEITTSANAIAFPTVTVGDTVSLDLSISNSGNELLGITGTGLPSSEMRIDTAVPFMLDPRQNVVVKVYLEPRRETSIGGTLTIESNDPLTPSKTIQIQTDIRALEMKSELLASTSELPLGEAVTVVVTPFPQVHIERGYVYHRSGHGPGGFQDSIPLSKYRGNYIATIPGAAVTEAGLEYFIKVENSGIFAADPPGAPSDSVFSREVVSPRLISASAQPNSGADFLEGRDINVLVSLPLGAEFVQGAVHYRPGGETAYQTSPFQADDPLPVAVIADTLIGPRGLEYWVEVQTLTASLTDPPMAPGEFPHSIRVTVPDLAEGQIYPEREYRMVSIPLDFGVEFTGSIEALLSDQSAFGPYDPVQWRSFRYLPASKGYAELSSETKEDFEPVPGRAFWLISASRNRIETGPIKGLSTTTDSAYTLVLEPGWNMIGDPFDFPVAWDSILVDGVKMAEAESLVVEPPVAYVIGQGYRMGAEMLEPFAGYWVKSLSDGNVVLRIPAKEASAAAMLSDSMAHVAALSDPAEAHDGWRLEIRASSRGAADCGNVIGVADGAAASWDKHDRSEPPMAPERAISLYFPHQSWERHRDNYAVDVRGAYEALPAAALKLAQSSEDLWGHIWRFDVAKNFADAGVGDEVIVALAGIENVPAEAGIYLVDRELGALVDARGQSSYSFHLGKREAIPETDARFMLIVGSKDFMDETRDDLPKPPDRTVLHQNYPNPFNPSTIIRYDLADACSVRLAIFNASGAMVKVLYRGNRQAGRYEEAWNGTNEAGRRVSTGIYFSRLETSLGFRQTRKLVLMR